MEWEWELGNWGSLSVYYVVFLFSYTPIITIYIDVTADIADSLLLSYAAMQSLFQSGHSPISQFFNLFSFQRCFFRAIAHSFYVCRLKIGSSSGVIPSTLVPNVTAKYHFRYKLRYTISFPREI
jgi:hypothetical protein